MNYESKLKEIRELNNMSQEKVADILNIKRCTYGHYETQYQIIPINHLIDFCDYFNVSLDYILDINKTHNKTFLKTDKIKAGIRLKEFRKNNKLTQEKLGTLLNTTKTVICGYEKGRYMLATPFLYTICKKYNISADYLIGRID